MGEKRTRTLTAYPYPVVCLDSEGRVVEAQERTKALFAPWSQGKRLLEAQVAQYGFRHACLLRFGQERFFSVMIPSPWEDGLWEMHLTRELFPALRRLTLTLLSCLETLWQGERDEGEERLRQSRALLRETLTPYRRQGPRVSCSVKGFFKALAAALSFGGVALSYACEQDVCVMAEPSFLRELICSLLPFTGALSAGSRLTCGLCVTAEAVEIELCGTEAAGLGGLEEVFSSEAGGEAVLASLPLLNGVLLCLQEDYDLRLVPREGKSVLTVTLPRSDALPDAFLGKDAQAETDRLCGILRRRGWK